MQLSLDVNLKVPWSELHFARCAKEAVRNCLEFDSIEVSQFSRT